MDNINISNSFQHDLEHFCKLERKIYFKHSQDWAGCRYSLSEHSYIIKHILCCTFEFLDGTFHLPRNLLYAVKKMKLYSMRGTYNLVPSYKCWLRLLWRKSERNYFVEQSITAQKNSLVGSDREGTACIVVKRFQ